MLRIWIIPGFLVKADLAQLALPNRHVVRRPGVVGPAMDRTLPKLRCQVKRVKRLDGGSFRRCGRTAAVGAAGPRCRLWLRAPRRRTIETRPHGRSEEHTSDLQSLMRIPYAFLSL